MISTRRVCPFNIIWYNLLNKEEKHNTKKMIVVIWLYSNHAALSNNLETVKKENRLNLSNLVQTYHVKLFGVR